MNFTNAVCMFVLTGILSAICFNGLTTCRKMEDFTAVKRNETLCLKFVSGSFKKTCMGKGFENLDQWQKCCKDLWKLDYIAWGKTEDDVGSTLMFGRWGGNVGEGEVFFRIPN